MSAFCSPIFAFVVRQFLALAKRRWRTSPVSPFGRLFRHDLPRCLRATVVPCNECLGSFQVPQRHLLLFKKKPFKSNSPATLASVGKSSSIDKRSPVSLAVQIDRCRKMHCASCSAQETCDLTQGEAARYPETREETVATNQTAADQETISRTKRPPFCTLGKRVECLLTFPQKRCAAPFNGVTFDTAFAPPGPQNGPIPPAPENELKPQRGGTLSFRPYRALCFTSTALV